MDEHASFTNKKWSTRPALCVALASLQPSIVTQSLAQRLEDLSEAFPLQERLVEFVHQTIAILILVIHGYNMFWVQFDPRPKKMLASKNGISGILFGSHPRVTHTSAWCMRFCVRSTDADWTLILGFPVSQRVVGSMFPNVWVLFFPSIFTFACFCNICSHCLQMFIHAKARKLDAKAAFWLDNKPISFGWFHLLRFRWINVLQCFDAKSGVKNNPILHPIFIKTLWPCSGEYKG